MPSNVMFYGVFMSIKCKRINSIHFISVYYQSVELIGSCVYAFDSIVHADLIAHSRMEYDLWANEIAFSIIEWAICCRLTELPMGVFTTTLQSRTDSTITHAVPQLFK